MRTLLVIAATVLICQYGTAQQDGRGKAGGRGAGGGRGAAGGRGQAEQPAPPPDPGFECFDRAETPEFPSAALQNGVDGTVWVRVQVTAQGAADKVDADVVSAWGTAPTLLKPAVEKAVRASKFKNECAGKTVAVVYRYELHGNATASPKPTTRTEKPNIMFIESQPQTKAAASSPAAKK